MTRGHLEDQDVALLGATRNHLLALLLSEDLHDGKLLFARTLNERLSRLVPSPRG